MSETSTTNNIETENNQVNKISKQDYYKQWKAENPDKLKQSRNNWYNANKDNDDFKNKKKEYQKQYYAKKKAEKTLII
jgi:hypothetical protein